MLSWLDPQERKEGKEGVGGQSEPVGVPQTRQFKHMLSDFAWYEDMLGSKMSMDGPIHA